MPLKSKRKPLTKYILKFPKIKDCFLQVYEHYYDARSGCATFDDSDVDKMLPQYGIYLDEETKKRLFESSDLDGNEDIEFREFLITIGHGIIIQYEKNPNHDHPFFCSLLGGFKTVKEMFDHIKTDPKSEVVTRSELEGALGSIGGAEVVKKRLEELDYNNDGSVDFPEFIYCIANWVDQDNIFDKEPEQPKQAKAQKEEKKVEQKQPRKKRAVSLTKYILKFSKIQVSFKSVLDEYNVVKQKSGGTVTEKELTDLLPKFGIVRTASQVKELFTAADLDGNKDIDFREFLITIGCGIVQVKDDKKNHTQLYKTIYPGMDVVVQMFDHLREDGCDHITHADLCGAMGLIGGDDLIKERIKELDYNGDGSVDFAEFIYCVSNWVDFEQEFD